ncbi:MAG: fibronectin type III domain-containing protein, partial [Kiloniellales bacterium]|nr:fibronectin type III domain-containing protein [Kiloniellales bacterium]
AIAFDPAPDTALPNPSVVVHPSDLTMTSGDDELIIAGDGTVVSQIKASWTPPPDVFVTQNGKIEIQYRRDDLPGPLDWSDGNTESRLVDGAASSVFLSPVEDGVTYDIRIRSINELGVTKDASGNSWGPVQQHTVVGKQQRPSEPDMFTADRMPDGTRRYKWEQANLPADVRVGGGFRIRYFLGATADWDAMTPLHSGLLTTSPYENNELAAGTYTFAIKTVDSSGNESVEPRFQQVTLGDPRLRDVLVGRLEHDLGFPGVKTDAFVESDGRLHSVTLGGWDALPATWDALAASFGAILPSPAQISYAIEIDLGADLSFTPLVTVVGVGTQTIEMRTGTSLPLAGGFGPLAAVMSKRYVEIRVTMTSPAVPAEPTCIELMAILLDGETKIEDFNDIDTSGPSTSRFERIGVGHFRIVAEDLSVISQAGITAIQNVGPGHSWELISKEALAFGPPGQLAAEFKLYDSAGALADAVIDVSLKGPKLT